MFSSTLRRTALAATAGAAAFTLSACGGGHSGSGPAHGPAAPAPGTSASAGAAAFNDADVMFARMMIPHHREAVEMARMAAGQAANPDVKRMATQIEAAQQPEIDTMTGWLTSWGRPTDAPAGGAHGSEHGGTMPGAMSAEDMAKLAAAKGAAFDKQFLTMMIVHHEGAVTMAKDELAKGSNAEAKALAQQIITSQQVEITTMKDQLTRV
jgi:uncharacterized protein (DUF305 family)